jgi:DNA topoisomerase VI subunit B
VTVEDDAVCVSDNGAGLPAATIERSLDYSVRVSDKNHYVSPTRGQLGNALKCVWAAPFVATGEDGRVEVVAGERRHVITVTVDRIAQRPELRHEIATVGSADVRTGTFLRVEWPGIAGYLDGRDGVLSIGTLLTDYAAFNPHASFAWQTAAAAGSVAATAAGWRKWLPGHPTSPHWYTAERLRELIAAYLTQERESDVRARTVREFIAEFRGLSGTAKQKTVAAAAGLTGASLLDLVDGSGVSPERVAALLDAMQSASRVVKPADLGVVGRDHLTRHLADERHVSEDSVRYHKVVGTDAGLPFVIEAAFGVHEDECAEPRRDLSVGLNWSAAVWNPIPALYQLLGAQRIDDYDPVAVVVHVACPVMQFTDRGKGTLQLPAAQSAALETVVKSVTKEWRTEKLRQDRVSRSTLASMRERRPKATTQKAAAYHCMEAAYLKASDGGRLPVTARMVMYAARPLVLAAIGKCWKNSSTFTQEYLPDYMKIHGCDTWKVGWDARGHFAEPHDGKLIGLGTAEVRTYLSSCAASAGLIDPSSLVPTRYPTAGPENRYRFALFIEKEGFNALLGAGEIAERFDIAIMSTKGMSVTAARTLVEDLSQRGVTTLVLHDFDESGFSILHTLRTDTRRYQFKDRPNVVDLGLRLADIEAMGLDSEPVEYKNKCDPRLKMRKAGATEEECAFLVRRHYSDGTWDGERVELNAMTAPQFIEWLEGKLVAHGVAKVVPDASILADAYRRAWTMEMIRESVAGVLAAVKRTGDASVPDELAAVVTDRIAGTATSWDDAVADLVREFRREMLNFGEPS